MFIGISSAWPLPFGSWVLNALSTFSSSSHVVGTCRPSLSSQALLIIMSWPVPALFLPWALGSVYRWPLESVLSFCASGFSLKNALTFGSLSRSWFRSSNRLENCSAYTKLKAWRLMSGMSPALSVVLR
ncbi:hypothetical protein BLIC_b02570 [Bifidobacterium longum subsp. infantis]|uniref:Uncharacterized protein n=1 Tax=Bifidobacterium longum subsp. infantis TaxID=1682 RepID=A0A564W141_BIFLI|nr:hypothetical protein BLIC_a02519 [Bifidobacterium longum subsp. infantis]CEF06086.1 hypothetical protein BLIC_b02570 [Bifidobacterium longum subsp. infantis]CEF07121.1 hypothetical protein BLIC_c02518 [Bifidobacterium longum subsp. infantis]CEF11924.1 hypothetical protein BLIC_e02536 [Bifidobacterium longum subsp. infantis]CEF14144.1 hypothetical protein BLIC_g02510 [Bifidobacterium longum subsp. infantis]